MALGFIKALMQKRPYQVGFKLETNLNFQHFRGGRLIDVRDYHNMLTKVGYAEVAGLINGATSGAFTYIATGTGTGAESADDTTLGTEIADSGLARASATCTRVTTTETNDTAQLYKSFSVTGTKAVTESGVFDAAAAGVMLARKMFAAINVISGDTLNETWKFKVTTA